MKTAPVEDYEEAMLLAKNGMLMWTGHPDDTPGYIDASATATWFEPDKQPCIPARRITGEHWPLCVVLEE